MTSPLQITPLIQRLDEYLTPKDSARFGQATKQIRFAVQTNNKKWALALIENQVNPKFGGKDPTRFFKQYQEAFRFERELERAQRAGMKKGQEVYNFILTINTVAISLNILIPVFKYAYVARQLEAAGSHVPPPDDAYMWQIVTGFPTLFAHHALCRRDRMTVWVNGRPAFHRESRSKFLAGSVGVAVVACGIYFVLQEWFIHGLVVGGNGAFLAFRGFTSYKFMANFFGQQTGRCNQLYTRFVRAAARPKNACRKMKNSCENLTNSAKQIGQFLGRSVIFLVQGVTAPIENVFRRAINFGL